MKMSLKEELANIMKGKDDAAVAEAFEKFCRRHAGSLPLPGQDSQFDKAMWAACEFTALTAHDEKIVSRVTGRLLQEEPDVVSACQLKLKDLIGAGKEAAINTWQDMLATLSWQQMVPAGALRGVGTQMVSLGTVQKDFADASIQLNVGWMVEKDELRILLQAKDAQDEALPDVELRIKEASRGVVYSRKTNEDGSVVAPSVHVGPGQYQIQVIYLDQVAETPFFVV